MALNIKHLFWKKTTEAGNIETGVKRNDYLSEIEYLLLIGALSEQHQSMRADRLMYAYQNRLTCQFLMSVRIR